MNEKNRCSSHNDERSKFSRSWLLLFFVLATACTNETGADEWPFRSDVGSSDVSADSTPDVADASQGGGDAAGDAADTDGGNQGWHQDFCDSWSDGERSKRLAVHENSEADWKIALKPDIETTHLTLGESADPAASAMVFRPPDGQAAAGFLVSVPVAEGTDWTSKLQRLHESVPQFYPEPSERGLNRTRKSVRSDKFGTKYLRTNGLLGGNSTSGATRFNAVDHRERLIRALLSDETDDISGWPSPDMNLSFAGPSFRFTAKFRSNGGGPESGGQLLISGGVFIPFRAEPSVERRFVLPWADPAVSAPVDYSLSPECYVRDAFQAPDARFFWVVSNQMSTDLTGSARTYLDEAAAWYEQTKWRDVTWGVVPMDASVHSPGFGVDWIEDRRKLTDAFDRVATEPGDGRLRPFEAAKWSYDNHRGPRSGGDIDPVPTLEWVFVSDGVASRPLSDETSEFAESRWQNMQALLPVGDCAEMSPSSNGQFHSVLGRGDDGLGPNVATDVCTAAPSELISPGSEQYDDDHPYPVTEMVAGTAPPRGIRTHTRRNRRMKPGDFHDTEDAEIRYNSDDNTMILDGDIRPDVPVDDEIERLAFTFFHWSAPSR